MQLQKTKFWRVQLPSIKRDQLPETVRVCSTMRQLGTLGPITNNHFFIFGRLEFLAEFDARTAIFDPHAAHHPDRFGGGFLNCRDGLPRPTLGLGCEHRDIQSGFDRARTRCVVQRDLVLCANWLGG